MKTNVVEIKPNINAKTKKGIKLMFGDDMAERIYSLIELNDTESGVLLAQKQMLITTLSLIPSAEEAAKSGGNGVYRYVQLVNLAQSQIETIKAQMDVQLVADSICDNTIQPTFLHLAQYVMLAMYRFRGELKDYIQAKDRKEVGRMINETIRAIAATLDEQNKGVQAKVRQRIVDV